MMDHDDTRAVKGAEIRVYSSPSFSLVFGGRYDFEAESRRIVRGCIDDGIRHGDSSTNRFLIARDRSNVASEASDSIIIAEKFDIRALDIRNLDICTTTHRAP